MTTKAQDFAALVAALPEEDFAQLAACVRSRATRPATPRFLSPAAAAGHADSAALLRLEESFVRHVREARNARQRLSRLRLLFVFLLLRHGGLRLAEVRAFDDRSAVDCARGLVRVDGSHARDVPLPPPVLALLGQVLEAPECQALRGTLAHMDEGYLRRSFYARAGECGVDPGLASARALRTARAVELCRGGMPPHIAQAFLGRPSADPGMAALQHPDEDVRTLIHYYLHRGMKMKTSARNVFPGRISALVHSGILVEARLATFTGLEVVAVITGESCRTLALSEGRTAIATVKAPWVVVEKIMDEKAPRSSARNRFPAKVVSVRGDTVAREVVAELAEGSRVCALITADSAGELELAEGDAVLVSFKAFSVILTLE